MVILTLTTGQPMSDDFLARARYGEAFWRRHHEAWCRSELNQREYCEAQGIPLKAFGNWRAKFKRGSLNSAHIHGTHVPVEEPSTASKPEVAARPAHFRSSPDSGHWQ